MLGLGGTRPHASGRRCACANGRPPPRDATLTEDQLEAASAKIVAAVEKQTGGVLRG